MGKTKDGNKQGSNDWFDKRLDDAVGKKEADRMRLEGYDRVEARVSPDGGVTIKLIK